MMLTDLLGETEIIQFWREEKTKRWNLKSFHTRWQSMRLTQFHLSQIQERVVSVIHYVSHSNEIERMSTNWKINAVRCRQLFPLTKKSQNINKSDGELRDKPSSKKSYANYFVALELSYFEKEKKKWTKSTLQRCDESSLNWPRLRLDLIAYVRNVKCVWSEIIKRKKRSNEFNVNSRRYERWEMMWDAIKMLRRSINLKSRLLEKEEGKKWLNSCSLILFIRIIFEFFFFHSF